MFKKEISEMEDDIFCKNLLEEYFNDSDPDKYGGIDFEEFATKMRVDLNGI